MSRLPRAALAAIAAAVLPGCLGEPPVEKRWTLLEVLEADPTSAAMYNVGAATTPVTMKVRITYREILTGFLVAELRAGNGVTTADVRLDGDDPLSVARDVDMVLQNSAPIGTAAIPVTGWDHLIQEMDVTFDAGLATPTAADSSVAAAAGNPVSSTGLFLVLYFSDDVEEVELASGEEIHVVVTPTLTTDRDILSTGIEVRP
jgi:hypothetical protein